jgi:hypothetical protein
MDLRKTGINEWRGRARDREVWRCIGIEAKAHPGCSAIEEEEKEEEEVSVTELGHLLTRSGVTCPEASL